MKKILILSILFIGALAMNVNAQTEVQKGAKIEFTKEVHNYGLNNKKNLQEKSF